MVVKKTADGAVESPDQNTANTPITRFRLSPGGAQSATANWFGPWDGERGNGEHLGNTTVVTSATVAILHVRTRTSRPVLPGSLVRKKPYRSMRPTIRLLPE